ncbi:MAG: hypothetical protein MRY83_18015 [Flavobacteriales bacterium]|nr:hypothetical protein [Flavobacteriales bacterium]
MKIVFILTLIFFPSIFLAQTAKYYVNGFSQEIISTSNNVVDFVTDISVIIPINEYKDDFDHISLELWCDNDARQNRVYYRSFSNISEIPRDSLHFWISCKDQVHPELAFYRPLVNPVPFSYFASNILDFNELFVFVKIIGIKHQKVDGRGHYTYTDLDVSPTIIAINSKLLSQIE